MDRKMLGDAQWKRVEQLLPGKATDRGVTAKDSRRFVEAVLRIMRTGSPWRDLPEALCVRLVVARIGSRMRARKADDTDGEVRTSDEGSCAGEAIAAGERGARRVVAGSWDFGRHARALAGRGAVQARSRGGLTTSQHLGVDALSNPVWVIVTMGQIADVV